MSVTAIKARSAALEVMTIDGVCERCEVHRATHLVLLSWHPCEGMTNRQHELACERCAGDMERDFEMSHPESVRMDK